MPKYCKEYCLQGYDKESYWTIHPELFEIKYEDGHKEKQKEKPKKHFISITANQKKMLTSCKSIGNNHNK